MKHRICDKCGNELLKESEVRYELKIEVKAAYERLNVTEKDFGRDYRAEIARVLQQLEDLSLVEAQNQVYRLFEFDLCPSCQRTYVLNPLN
jgi:hypothetical protein